MTYLDKLRQIDEIQASILENGPIAPELLNKINYKLRLEWNYTSNSMEGNSLTRRETRTVMVNAIEVNGKPIKDIAEIRNHDKVISTIMKIGKGELNISESRIKEIHKGIMYEDDPEKQKLISQWKNTDNYMINFQGERYDFVPHAEVPERMHSLMNWTNSEKEKIQQSKKDAIHPISLAFKFHLNYLAIHPFYDGNGRTARIFTNLILISYGYPPLYVNENEKQNYHRYLTDIQSYGGEPDLFYEFMADLLLRSMRIITDAIEGKNIEDEDDFIKEIQLLKSKTSAKNTARTPKIVYETFKSVDEGLWGNIKATLKYFDDLFNENQTDYAVNNKRYRLDGFGEFNTPLNAKIFGNDIYENDITTVSWEHKMLGLNGADTLVDFKILLTLTFQPYKYNLDLTTSGNTNQESLKSIYQMDKLYETSFLPGEIADINASLKANLLESIKDKIGE
jgi:Fic family protein